ncbi:MAG TPA: hypothetical protein VL134_03645 [Leptolyngbya sp.]|jgi:hypothetical protein|nr:hypothetical protein [Leptolyngbya sp.]
MTSNASIRQSSNTAVCEPQTVVSETTLTIEKLKRLYRADQQTKLLDLQAEAELLLKQLQALKQQRTEV